MALLFAFVLKPHGQLISGVARDFADQNGCLHTELMIYLRFTLIDLFIDPVYLRFIILVECIAINYQCSFKGLTLTNSNMILKLALLTIITVVYSMLNALIVLIVIV